MKRAAIIIHFLLLVVIGTCAAQDSTDIFSHVRIDSMRNSWHASLAGNDAGLWFCAWSERTQIGAAIRGAFLTHGQRTNIAVRDLSTSPSAAGNAENIDDERPAAVFLTDSSVLIAWQRRSGGANFIVARVLYEDGRMTDVFTVSDDSAPGMMPAAGRGTGSEVVVAWQDYRNGDVDVYTQHFDAAGHAVGRNVRINDDPSHAMQGAPHFAADNGENLLLFWPDNRDDQAWKFYYQRIDSPTDKNILIDSAQRKAMTTLISGVCLPGDSAVFTWKDYREGHSNIYRRVADLKNATLSSAERINDDRGKRWQRLAVVDGNGRGNLVLCWEDYRNTEINQRGDIYLQVFARDGNRIGGNLKVNDRDDRIARKMPSVSMQKDDWYLIIWHQGEEGAFHLVGQWLQYPTVRKGGNFCLTCEEE